MSLQESDRNEPLDIRDLMASVDGHAEKVTEFRKFEGKRYRDIVSSIFRESYKKFKKRQSNQEILYAGDFRQVPGEPFEYTETLEILLPSDIFLTIDYNNARRGFLKIVKNDIAEGPQFGRLTNVPAKPETEALRKLIAEDKDAKVDSIFWLYRLNHAIGQNAILLVSRYMDPTTHEPIAEVWKCKRLGNNEKAEFEGQREVSITDPYSNVPLLLGSGLR